MAQRLVLHVGTMKSGTSYLQELLFAEHDRLAAAGVLAPGPADRPNQAVLQVISGRQGGEAWDRLTDAVRRHPGDAVLSSELLAPVGDKAAQRVLDGLAADRVEVVVTARDLNRVLVSMWQETIQNGRTWKWEEYVAAVRDAAPGRGRGHADKQTAGGTFWRQQHVARIVGDWAARVGAERVALVTLPPSGADRTLLPRRFADATGLPLDPTAPVEGANEALGLASLLMLRELNERLAERGVEFSRATRLRKKVLAKTALADLAGGEPRLGLEVTDWVREQTAATVAALRATGVRLVGDWADLEPVPVPGATPADVDEPAIGRAALAGLVEVVADVATRKRSGSG